ncbi:zinc finger CCCH domain-containing protein 14 [Anoplophora glabripennis]|uniref:zinc finger CCCH domain-containing protein 14 n=1 Tax=Anoplophora glabripennis TaxID=217634 RepID=UPI000874BEAD|nr:zinc finger CCCH domain-containing protein 14 [Anoplophora glabripennis]
MDSIGAEVGQKMRSAIKAKLLELNCYVDDELPDYIMVMVANKRTKSQMNEDLNLFLSTKTSTFVDWLHIVLKKLKEVTVTNPEVYKKVTKRKLTEAPDVKVKKEKKDLVSIKERKERIINTEMEHTDSLTDNLPVNSNRLSEQRKITVVNESSSSNNNDIFDIPLLSQVNNISSEKDLQEIERKIKSVKSRLGLLVDSDIEEELPEIKSERDGQRNKQKKINNPKTLTYIQSELDDENDRVSKNEETGLSVAEEPTISNTSFEKKTEHKRITFEEESPPRKISILKRLGSRPNDNLNINPLKTRISLSEFRKEEEPFLKYSSDKKNEERLRDWRRRKEYRTDRSRRENDSRRSSSEERRRDRSRDRNRDRSVGTRSSLRKEGILSRLGVMSKVSVPVKEPDEPEPENELKTREVRSMVQVKPRIIPSGTPQPNKNLLLKAVAEAQRSVAQTPHVGSHSKSISLNSEVTRDSEKNVEEEAPVMRKFSQREKNKLKHLILSHASQSKANNSEGDGKSEEEYIPKPIKECPKETPKYIPSHRLSGDLKDNAEIHQQFIVTLDGIEKKFSEPKSSIKDRLDRKTSPGVPLKLPVKSRLDIKKSPSPIIFDKVSTSPVNSKPNIPDKLPIVHPSLSVKNKERCKYWPNCRQGDKCEFVHPSSPCEMFPLCKFREKCLYLHPNCKFGSACTKRECPYSHAAPAKLISRTSSGASAKLAPLGLQTCKFFPNCTNSNCQFFHPKPCKFGKYCKNQSDCNFSHFISSKSSLIWRSK